MNKKATNGLRYRCALIALFAGCCSGVTQGQNVVTWHGNESCCNWTQVSPPSYNFAKVAVANNYMVGIDGDGFLIKWVCSGEVTQYDGLFSHVGGGEFFHVALQAPSGVVQHWGDTTPPAHFDEPTSAYSFKDLSVGEYHSIGVVKSAPEESGLEEGNLLVWGSHDHHYWNTLPGFNCSGSTCDCYPPPPLSTLSPRCYWTHKEPAHLRFNLPEPYRSTNIEHLKWKVIAAGAYNSAGILDYPEDPEVDGRLIVWGSDKKGPTGDGELVSRAPVEGKFKAVSLGHRHCLAIKTGDPSVEGQLSVWSWFSTLTSGAPAPSVRFISVSGGYQTSCAVSTYGQVYCWGTANCGGPATTLPGNNFLSLAPGHSGFGNLAILQGPACYANCDRSTTPPLLTANDFICFNVAFVSNDPYADCDGVGGLTANDYTCFAVKYTDGCGQ